MTFPRARYGMVRDLRKTAPSCDVGGLGKASYDVSSLHWRQVSAKGVHTSPGRFCDAHSGSKLCRIIIIKNSQTKSSGILVGYLSKGFVLMMGLRAYHDVTATSRVQGHLTRELIELLSLFLGSLVSYGLCSALLTSCLVISLYGNQAIASRH